MPSTALISNKRSQTVRLPTKLRLPDGVKRVEIRARGRERIITPVGHTWDSFFIDGPQVSEDFMKERTSQD